MTSPAKPPARFCKNCMQPADAHDDAECQRRGPAILPAKPPAPMEPCRYCGGAFTLYADDGGTYIQHESVEAPEDRCFLNALMWGDQSALDQLSRRAAPAPSDGEVGELVKRIERAGKAEADIAGDWLFWNWLEIKNALSRQSAELAEAKQGKLAADLRADGWKALSEQTAAELAEAREDHRKFVEWADGLTPPREAAERALLALGCKPGPEGWMRPCECGTRGCETFHPIPGAGAKEKKDELPD